MLIPRSHLGTPLDNFCSFHSFFFSNYVRGQAQLKDQFLADFLILHYYFLSSGSRNLRLTYLKNIDGCVLPSLIELTTAGVNSGWPYVVACRNINQTSGSQFYLTPSSLLIAGSIRTLVGADFYFPPEDPT